VTIEASTNQARAAASSQPGDKLLEALADRVGAKAGVHAVFGEPIHRDGLTVVPVARVRWGFGGGAGSAGGDPDFSGPGSGSGSRSGSGSGGGGGVAADPVGYLEIGPGGASFRAIREPYPSPLFLLAAGMTAAVVIRALARLVRG
jgi:uncharacterized spore protein YtfJ